MPIVGNLSEFPLPEVLLLIGSRTGRLRLYEVPQVTEVEIDISEGQAHALHIGESLVTESAQIVAELSFIVVIGDGMFEFSPEPVVSVRRDELLPINQLVMSLVLHVDEKLAKQQALLAPQLFYLLEIPKPETAIEPGLNQFYQQGRQLLAEGVRAEDLAEYLGLSEDYVRLNLDTLWRLGFLKLMETSDVHILRETMLGKEITKKTDEYLFAVEASDLIRRSGKLFKLPSAHKG